MMRRPRSDHGSLSLELTVIAPVILVILAFLALAGRVSASHGQVQGAARDAARVASLTRGDPKADAQSVADAAFSGKTDPACLGGPKVTIVGTPTPGQMLVARVTCSVDITGLGIPGLPPKTVTVSVAAPVDQYTAPR